MKNLKVRVWDYGMNQMIYAGDEEYLFTITENGVRVDDLTFTVTVDENEIFEDIKCEVMLSTGLKDTKGKEIYGKDIIKVTDDNGQVLENISNTGTGIVNFCYGMWYVDGIENGLYDLHESYNIEIIGNIFENPELIGQKHENKELESREQ